MFIRLSSRAVLRFDQQAGAAGLFLGSGKAHFLNRQDGITPRIETNVVSAAVRGTEFVVDAEPETTTIAVLEGSVEAINQYGSALIGPGEQAITIRGSAPIKSVLISPANAVQWTASVPVVFDWSIYGANQETEDLVKDHDYSAALERIRATPSMTTNAKLLEAELLLSLGQIDEASRILAQQDWQGLSAQGQSHLNALRSLIALTRNDLAGAQASADQALAQDASYSGALLALSYVQQANKDLEAARDTLQRAYAIDPDQPLLAARLAEIKLGFGDTRGAQRLITQALSIAPSDSYAITVQGFINLFNNELDAARVNFELASKIDPASGLPLLGLGLTKIHAGDFGAGKTEIERAVHLEPTRAIYRSYLGKAFFELDHEERAAREYEEAIRLDPNDPTPFLYRGFYQLSKNRLVDALADVEHSFALNNNRAIFRSSLLLDQDLAVRSAGLSKIFTQLGFSQSAQLEAVNALSKDATNFSAHRLLADSRKEIFYADASLSEQRIADLLAPLSFNLFSSLGGQASLNEYDALFDQSEHRTFIEAEYDQGADRLATTATHSGKTAKMGYAMAASTAMGDGSKSGNYNRDSRLDAALRFQVAPDQRLLLDAHGIYNKVVDYGAEPQEVEFNLGGGGIGYNYRFDANSTVLIDTSATRQRLLQSSFDATRTVDSTQIFEGVEDTLLDDLFLDQMLNEYVTAVRGGAQYIFQSERFSSVAGFQLLHQDPDRNEDSVITEDSLDELGGFGLRLLSASSTSVDSNDFYLYPTFHVLPWLDLTAGIVYTDLENEEREVPPFIEGSSSQTKWSPKTGITARPFTNLTLRTAYFESLQKSSLEDQISIEPTLIGGITQRFNDLSGTQSRNYGVGADYKIAAETYFGAEYLRRHLTQPQVSANTEIVTDIDNQEQYTNIAIDERYDLHLNQDFIRTYVYQVFSPSLVGTLDYRYAYEDLTDPDIGNSLEMQRAAAQLRYFASNGVFTFGRTAWLQQHGVDNPFLDGNTESATLLDAGIGYRLPNRRGIVQFEVLNITDQDFNFDQSRGFQEFVSSGWGLRLVAAVNF